MVKIALINTNGRKSYMTGFDGSPTTWNDADEAQTQIAMFHQTTGLSTPVGPPQNFTYAIESA